MKKRWERDLREFAAAKEAIVWFDGKDGLPTFNSLRYAMEAQETSIKLILIKCSKNKTSKHLIHMTA